MKILLCGCGALGSQIALHLARPELEFVLVDDDRVEEGNVATSAYGQVHIGMQKVTALATILWQKCRCMALLNTMTLSTEDIPSMRSTKADLVIDTFDNAEARSIVCQLYWFHGLNVIHAGVSVDRTGEIIWNDKYKLPTVRIPRGENPICTHELGTSILRFTAVLCANIVEDWMETRNERSVVITRDWEVLG